MLQNPEPHYPDFRSRPERAEYRVGNRGGPKGHEVFAAPLPTTPQARVLVTRRVQRDPARHSHTKQMVARAVEARPVTKLQDALGCDFPVGLERVSRRGLVKWHAKVPFAVMAVGEIAVTENERRAAAEEVRVDEVEIETAPIGIVSVNERQLRGRPEKIALDEAHVPRLVAAHAREARLGLGAPAIRRHGLHRKLPAGLTNRIHAHRAEHP